MGVVFEDVFRLKVGGATCPQVFIFIKDSQRVYKQCKMQCIYIYNFLSGPSLHRQHTTYTLFLSGTLPTPRTLGPCSSNALTYVIALFTSPLYHALTILSFHPVHVSDPIPPLSPMDYLYLYMHIHSRLLTK